MAATRRRATPCGRSNPLSSLGRPSRTPGSLLCGLAVDFHFDVMVHIIGCVTAAVQPDIAAFAKSMSNGFPMAAVIGRRDVMQAVQKSFISSTYWSDTIGLAAGIATIKEIKEKPVISTISSIGIKLMEGLTALGNKHNIDLSQIPVITFLFNSVKISFGL